MTLAIILQQNPYNANRPGRSRIRASTVVSDNAPKGPKLIHRLRIKKSVMTNSMAARDDYVEPPYPRPPQAPRILRAS